ncbi:PorP/SprF family type IX secretion system membrane protein [Fulvivirga kasyanovii]|uniref:Type IX secretion system membrane protein PorP/SprF n=1 Tax=Fulvivirga kasyanovii TaxID=396812 RepID=A0ABW9RT46_9BACT|nr:type IX secretion system membrane protein PorP/SprF [Fulvivirga kasyanovii]MTI27066.1 type IX secretion system membrane protein PorP/SprF [Fulvivirga kasyanovii]
MKKLLPFVFMLCWMYNQSEAQQDPLYAQYINNPLVINPAYTGINNVLNASLSHRAQWTSLEGAPNTTSLSAHSSFFENKVGGGILLVRDELGATTTTQFNVTGSYKIEFGESAFSFGMQAGVLNLKENNDELLVKDPNDPVFTGNESFSKFNIGAGVALKGPEYYVGLSIPRMIKTKEEFGNIETQVYQRHFYLAAGYVYHVGVDFALKPSILLKGVADAPLSVDYNASLIFRDKYTVGLISRNFQTYGLLAQLNINDNFRFGYIFEVPTEKSVGSSFNTHELTLTLDMEVFDFHFLSERYF